MITKSINCRLITVLSVWHNCCSSYSVPDLTGRIQYYTHFVGFRGNGHVTWLISASVGAPWVSSRDYGYQQLSPDVG